MKDVDRSLFTGVPAKKVSEIIYEQIREKILAQELKPGDRLPTERTLITLFDCSRPTIREALRMLEQNHYVTILRGSGIFVNPASTAGVERNLHALIRMEKISKNDVQEVREICETLAVRLAALRRTDADIAAMNEILSRSQEQIQDFDSFFQCGVALNDAFARASKNPVFRIVNSMTAPFSREQVYSHPEGANSISRSEILSQHRGIVEAIIARDAELACARNRAHIKGTFSTI